MASERTLHVGDTYPPLRGLASDEAGPVDLSTADALQVRIKSGATLITGTPIAVQPPASDADGREYNWEYDWALGDTANPGDYVVQLKVTWDAAAVPPQIETFPNDGGGTLTIETAN